MAPGVYREYVNPKNSGREDARIVYRSANPRAPKGKLISSQPRYDLFDTSPHETNYARIVYRSEKPLGAVITGAEEIKTWEKYRDNVWVCRIDNGVFGSYNPI